MIAKPESGYGYYRWSSSAQTEGDSKDRQTRRIAAFAKQNEIELIDTFGDEAVSAKDGANLEKEFAKLLKVLKDGQCIIVENLDRISRQDAIDTLHFLKHKVILAKNATIFTYHDGQHYCKENISNLGTKLTWFLQTELGHQENQKRIERARDFFTGALAQLKNGIPVAIGAKLPSWIKVENGKWGFNEDKKLIIQGIFRDYLAGIGMRTIAVNLNKANTPPLRAIKKKTVWSVSTISTLLHSENVIGTLNFRDEKIKSCFPSIVSEKDFTKVQVKLEHHKNRHGKVTDNYRVSNLFRGLTRCNLCNANVMVEKCVGHKDRKEKTYHYFACFHARQGKCLAKKRINADTIEKAFFVDCLQAAPTDLLTNDNKEALLEVANVEEKLAEVERNIAKYLELMEKGYDFGKIEARLSELREQKRRWIDELAILKQRASSVTHLPQVLKSFTKLINEDLASDETRRKIVNLMPYLVKEVVFFLKDYVDFEVTFVNGVKWCWTSSAMEVHLGVKNKKLVIVKSFHDPVDGIWGNLLKEPGSQ